jgi:hypothetical protein
VSSLRVDGRLDGEPNMLVDQLTKRDSLRLVRDCWLPDTLAHGALLRWLPGGWLVVHFMEECAISLFSHEWDATVLEGASAL